MKSLNKNLYLVLRYNRTNNFNVIPSIMKDFLEAVLIMF